MMTTFAARMWHRPAMVDGQSGSWLEYAENAEIDLSAPQQPYALGADEIDSGQWHVASVSGLQHALLAAVVGALLMQIARVLHWQSAWQKDSWLRHDPCASPMHGARVVAVSAKSIMNLW